MVEITSGRTMTLGSTHPLTEMSTSCISWGKGGRGVRLTTLPPSCDVVMKSGNLNFLEPFGHPRTVKGLLYLYLSYDADIEIFYLYMRKSEVSVTEAYKRTYSCLYSYLCCILFVFSSCFLLLFLCLVPISHYL